VDQARRTDVRHPLAALILAPLLVLVSGCSTPPAPGGRRAPAPERQADPSHPDPAAEPEAPAKPEPRRGTRRMGSGGVEVDRLESDDQEPTPCRVVLKTWSDEVIRGVLLERDDESYKVDVSSADVDPTRRSIRVIPRSSIMSEQTRPLGSGSEPPPK